MSLLKSQQSPLRSDRNKEIKSVLAIEQEIKSKVIFFLAVHQMEYSEGLIVNSREQHCRLTN